MANLWFDFTNPPHVNFYLPIIKYFKSQKHTISITARDFVETIKLLEIYKLNFQRIGKHGGKNKLSKINQLIQRDIVLYFKTAGFDLSFSSNYDAPLVSWLKHKPALVFDDNDISPNWLYSKFSNYVISPVGIDKDAMYRMGISKNKLLTYPGFKEDIYIADYTPDPDFLSNLPFREFVVVRPENLQASYVKSGSVSIVPELVSNLVQKGINVLYLPRYKSDQMLVTINDHIYIPSSPLNGLDVCFYSNAVLTGAGTFSREAAVMGVPAVSFYAGNEFLGVDKKMFHDKSVFFSRNAAEITDYVLKSKKRPFNQQKSKDIQKEFFELLSYLVNKLTLQHS
jgi:predicted glycosyltransferase